MIHSGSVVAAGISQGRSTSLRLDFRVSNTWLKLQCLHLMVYMMVSVYYRSSSISALTRKSVTLWLQVLLLVFQLPLELQLAEFFSLWKRAPASGTRAKHGAQ